MFLESDILKLRALEPSDLDLIVKWENDSALWSVSNMVEPFSVFMLREYISYCEKSIYEKGQLRLMIVDRVSGATVGAVDIFDFAPRHLRGGVGIVIDDRFRGCGFASEALRLLAQYAFGFLNMVQLYAHIPVGNVDSISLFEGAGFSRSGLLRDWIVGIDGREDVAVYQLFADSFSELAKPSS